MAAADRIADQPATDETLIQRIQAKDQAAFDLLYDRYFPRVTGYVRKRIDNHADAEEIVQEVFINVFTSLESFRGDAPFAAWVLGVSRRTIAGRFKKKRHITVPLDSPDHDADSNLDLHPQADSPHDHYEARERVAQFEATAKSRLSLDQWQLIELHHLKNHSVRTMALELNRSEDSIKSNLYRARKLLLAR